MVFEKFDKSLSNILIKESKIHFNKYLSTIANISIPKRIHCTFLPICLPPTYLPYLLSYTFPNRVQLVQSLQEEQDVADVLVVVLRITGTDVKNVYDVQKKTARG